MVALFRRATLVIGGDTGPIHVAAVSGLRRWASTGRRARGGTGRTGPGRRPSRAPPGGWTASRWRPSWRRPRVCSLSRGGGMPRMSVAVVTLNEEERLRACLESVVWADEIVVVDAGSSDKTVAIAREFTDRVQFRAWDGYGTQKNFALGLCRGDWILSLDADERSSEALRSEIQARAPAVSRRGGLLRAAAEPVPGPVDAPRRACIPTGSSGCSGAARGRSSSGRCTNRCGWTARRDGCAPAGPRELPERGGCRPRG